MPQELVVAPVGLFTDPNPLSAAPPGSMTEALNVVIARPGVIEPRPGFQADATFTAHLVDEDIVRIIPFESDLLVLTKDASDGTGHAYWFSANDDMVQSGVFATTSTAFTLTTGRIHGASAKGNLYFTCAEGVFRAVDPGDDTAERAGLPRSSMYVGIATAGVVNNPHAANTACAYRACRSKVAGKLTIRSAPSHRAVRRRYTGATDSACSMYVQGAGSADDTFECYRSPITSGYANEPSDELAMIGTSDVLISSGIYTYTRFTDDVKDTGLRGSSLYTNATQHGALLENGLPPLCRDVAFFREMQFFGAAESAPALTFEVLGWGPDWRGTNTSYVDRLSYAENVSGTVALGSTSITGIAAADILKLHVGMRVYKVGGAGEAADTVFAADTYIESVGATSVTVSSAALSNAVAFSASDWISASVTDSGGTYEIKHYLCSGATVTAQTIPGREFALSATAESSGPHFWAYTLTGNLTTNATPACVSAFGDGNTTPWTLVIETYAQDVTSITVKISNVEASSERIDRTTGKTATRAGSVATLAWSKPGEPEHVPPGYNTEIGASDKAIERIVAAADALYVFKEDGVWRVTGYSPDTLQVDEFDRTMRLVHPDAACEWDGRVAAWTNKGVMLIGGGGAQEISLPIANIIQDATDVHAGNVAQGVFMTGWLDRGLLLLGIPSTTATGYAEYIYCWSQRTGAWTRWNHSKPITTAAAVGDTLYFGTKAPSAAGKASVLVSADDSYDVSTSVTVASVTGTSVTINGGSGWTPAVGDIVNKGGADYAVTAITSATAFTVHTTGLTTGAATAYERSDVELEWTVRDGENPGAQKLFREATFLFGSAVGVTDISSSYVTDRSRTAATSTATLDYTTSAVPETVRTRIPREAKRCGRTEHAVTIPGAKPAWTLHGASYVYEPLNTRFPNAG